MARAAQPAEPGPEPDRREGAPHPRDADALFGQEEAEAGFLAAWGSGRLHSGWIFAGPEGVGKATLAYRIAGSLLAARPGAAAPATLGLPPDHPDARLVRSGAHPRLLVLRRGPDDKGRLRAVIAVEDARSLRDFFGMTAADGGRRVVIVDAADDLNANAANALLKLLEEPPRDATLLLVAHAPWRLLPTIRSRCRTLRLAALGPADLALALAAIGRPEAGADAPRLAALAGGSVGAAVRLADDDGLATYGEIARIVGAAPRMDRPAMIRLAESCAGRGGSESRFALVLDLLDLFLARLARTGLVGGPATEATPGEAALLVRLSPNASAARAWADRQQASSTRARTGRALNLDPAGLILDMLVSIEATARRAAAA